MGSKQSIVGATQDAVTTDFQSIVETKAKQLLHYFLEMSLSWNFPALAKPSYEGSELSRAETLQFSS
jgi:hypothetical protein